MTVNIINYRKIIARNIIITMHKTHQYTPRVHIVQKRTLEHCPTISPTGTDVMVKRGRDWRDQKVIVIE